MRVNENNSKLGQNGGSRNSKILSRDTHMTDFDLILNFFRQNSAPSVSMPNLNFLALKVREILGGPKIPKLGPVTNT